MKTGFAEHFIASFCIVSLFLLFFGLTDLYLFCSLFFLLGSFAPDIDHPDSIPRRVGVLSAFIILFFAIAFLVFILTDCFETFLCVILTAIFSVILSLLLTHLLTKKIPRHRGKLHKLKAACFFGLMLFAIAGVSYSKHDALMYGASAAGGYSFHLLVDAVGDLF